MLNYLNNNFVESSKRTKIELYLLPLLVFLSIYLFFIEKEINQDIKISSKLSFEDFKHKKFQDSFLDFFSSLEKLAKKYEIIIVKNEKSENIILLKATGNKESILNFIKAIENLNNFTKIDSFTLNKNDEIKDYTFDLRINLSKYYIKNLKEVKYEIKNKEKPIITQKIENTEFKINAIVANYVFINEKWLEKDEKIGNYKLIKIEKDFVVLSDELKEIKLELKDEEYFKKFN
jgi:hypothetical protein